MTKLRKNITITPATHEFIKQLEEQEGRNYSNAVETIIKRYAASINKHIVE